jgi:hypothetical protein
MSLTITEVLDGAVPLGESNSIRTYQLTPGVSDYVAGGYPITAAQLGLTRLYGAHIIAKNSSGLPYGTGITFPSSSFGAIPTPATSINLSITQQGGGGVGLPLTTGAVATATLSALTTNVATVTAANTFLPGQFVALQGAANAGFADLNGLIVQVITASATGFTFNYTHANVASGADVALTATQITAATGPLNSGTAIASTNSALTTNVATITIANTFQPGQFVVLQGFTNALATAFNGYIVEVITATATGFTFNFNHANIASAADTGTAALVVAPGNAPITVGRPSSISNTALTSNVVSLTSNQQLFAGQVVIVQGLTAGAALNGQLLQVISTGLTNALFEANIKSANIGTAADVGIALPLVAGPSTAMSEVPAGTNLSGLNLFLEVRGY